MTRFVPGPRLDQRVATRWAIPEARRLAEALADRARANAPDAGAWVTMQDPLVRDTHEKADGQTIPDNLRFILEHPSVPDEEELARAPRDPDLSIGNRINCRCLAVEVPGVIAEAVSATEPVLRGAAARATVAVSFNRIVESEHPGQEDSGGGWMRRSIEETAAGRAHSH